MHTLTTRFTATGRRPGLMTAAAMSAVAAMALTTLMFVTGLSMPAAGAAPDPCAASQVAKTVGSVATNTGTYLDAHPETDQALTAISQQPAGPHSVAMLKAYFASNPEVATQMQRLQQPLVALSSRCKLPVTVPQILGLMQAVQQGQELPNRVPAPQNVGVGTSSTPASQRPQAAPGGAGLLPGPA